MASAKRQIACDVLPWYRSVMITNGCIDVCCLQALSSQATKRLSFVYKLRSPDNVVLPRIHKHSATGKDDMYALSEPNMQVLLSRMISIFTLLDQPFLACRCTTGITASELMRQFDQHHMSINQVTVCAVCCLCSSLPLLVAWQLTHILANDCLLVPQVSDVVPMHSCLPVAGFQFGSVT